MALVSMHVHENAVEARCNEKSGQTSKIAYPIREGFKIVGLSPARGYEEIKAGYLRPRYIGSKPVLTHEELERYVATLPDKPLTPEQRRKRWGVKK